MIRFWSSLYSSPYSALLAFLGMQARRFPFPRGYVYWGILAIGSRSCGLYPVMSAHRPFMTIS